jgi:hypothetical protein
MKIFLIPLIVTIGFISNFSIASARHACFFGIICRPHPNTNSYNDCRSAGCASDEICTNNRPGPSLATDPYFCKKKSEPMYRGMTNRTSSVGPTPQSISLPRPTTPTYTLTPPNIPTTQKNPATTPCVSAQSGSNRNATGWALTRSYFFEGSACCLDPNDSRCTPATAC